jgi:hypothetical protein
LLLSPPFQNGKKKWAVLSATRSLKESCDNGGNKIQKRVGSTQIRNAASQGNDKRKKGNEELMGAN